jgi:hypothetical protein
MRGMDGEREERSDAGLYLLGAAAIVIALVWVFSPFVG